MDSIMLQKSCAKKATKNKSSMKTAKSRQLSAFDLAKVVSKPMLVIPQPILHTHECLTDVRMTRVESNAYVALGIKEEPMDEEEYERDVNNAETWDRKTNDEQSQPKRQEFRARTRQQLKQLELDKKRASCEDTNNNNNNIAEEVPVLSVQTFNKSNNEKEVVPLSVPPTNKNNGKQKNSIIPIQPFASFPNHDIISMTSNNELDSRLNKEPPVDNSALGNASEMNSNDNHSPVNDSPYIKNNQQKALHSQEELTNNLDDNSDVEKPKNPTLISKDKNESTKMKTDEDNQNLLNDQPTLEDDFEFADKMSSSSEDTGDIFPKLWVLKAEERSSLVCGVCKKKFSRVSILVAHKKKHFDPKVYNCSHCNKTFSSESSYKHHIAYSGLAPYKCDQCQKSYYTEQKCNAHKEQCTGKNTERKYHCEECGRSYVMLCSLRTHIRERHSDFQPVKNLCCELCGKRFRHRKYLDLHMYSHSSEKNFECTICQRKYKSSDILRHHVRMVHKNPPKVTCTTCAKEVSRVSLKAHMNRHREKEIEERQSARNLLNLAGDSNSPHCTVCASFFESDKLLEMHCCRGIDGSFTCPHCAESFGTADDLGKHSCQLDEGESADKTKIYRCVFCRRQYNCHTPWLYHVRHHTGDKPYPCPQCNKSFRLKQGLKVHMRNHTGEKPFKCDQCPAAFKQKPFLLDHINTHTGEKPYQCQRCLSRFSVRSALSTHKRIHRREFLKLQNE